MSPIKEKIYGAIELMNEKQAEYFWTLICENFSISQRSWDDIEEVEPDEIDLQMLKEISEDPDCREFISAESAYKELGIDRNAL